MSDSNGTQPKPPRAPAGLGGAGRRLWRSVVNGFELRPDELELLAAACRLGDEVTALEDMIVKSTPLTIGSKNQVRVNPLYSEVRAHRLALGRLLASLGLADAGDVDGAARSSAARRMVRARWSGR